MEDLGFVFAEVSKADVDFYDYDVTIAGKRGSGKTTLAIELYKDNCCLVDVEKGAKGIGGIYKIVPETWKELKNIQKKWSKAIKAGNKPPFSVLLFDTQTKLQLMCQEFVLDENGWEDFVQGSDNVNRWNVLKNEYVSVMDGFKALGFKIVRICHGKDKKFKPRGQEEYNQYAADVGATFDYDVLGAVDFVFYLEKTRITDDDGNKKEVRRLVMQNDMDYDVKCRFPELPDEIVYEEASLGVKAFFDAWDSAVNKKTSKTKQASDDSFVFPTKAETVDDEPKEETEEPIAEQEELSYEELVDKATEIRDKLLQEMERSEVINLLKDELGYAVISKCKDEDKLKSFIANHA